MRETEVYVQMCCREEIPADDRPGTAHAGGLTLAGLRLHRPDDGSSDPRRWASRASEYFGNGPVLGPRRAKEILYTGRRFGAAEALDWGMLNHVVPRDELQAKVDEIAGEIKGMPLPG